MIGKKYNSKRSKMDTVKKQNITVLIICVIVVAVTIIGVQFIPKKENNSPSLTRKLKLLTALILP